MDLNNEKDNYLKKETQFFQTEHETKNWLDFMGIKNYSINQDLLVDVDGGVDISNSNLKAIPVQFGRVKVSFSCNHNQLTSLKGSPVYVGGHFHCSSNNLVNLNGGPERVVFDYDCRDNLLNSLKGAPTVVGNFDCGLNNLITLKHSPKLVTGSFNCSGNRLTALDNAPEKVNGQFISNDNSFDDITLINKDSDSVKHYLKNNKLELEALKNESTKSQNTSNDFRADIEKLDTLKLDAIIAESKRSLKELEAKSNVVSIAEVKNDIKDEPQLANTLARHHRRLKL